MRLTESNLETIDFRTIVNGKTTVSYIHRDEQSLIYALKHGEKRLNLPPLGPPVADDVAMYSHSHTLTPSPDAKA